MISRLKKIILALSRTERIILFLSLAAAIVSAASLSSIAVGQLTKTVAASGGDFSEGFVGQPSFVNPVLASTEIDKTIVRLVFSNLKDLAEKIEPGSEGRTWRIRLKEDVVWHDEAPLTSDDVVFTIQKIQDQDSPSPQSQSWQGVRVDRVSEREVEFNLGVPYAFFDANLEGLYVLPKHLFENVPVANWRISDFNLKPIGSGPYQFEKFEARPDGFITAYRLKSNPHYFGKSPFLNEFELRFYTRKEDAIEAFNLGRIDGLSDLGVPDLGLLNRSYELLPFFLPNYYAVFLNQNQHIALKESAVRKALVLAVDKLGLVLTIFDRRASVVNGPLPPPARYANEKLLKKASTTFEDAAHALEAAGWAINSNGVREKQIKKSPVTLEFTLSVPNLEFLVKTAEALRAAWEKIGIQVTIHNADLEEIKEVTIKNRDYQMILYGNTLIAGSDLFSFWHSSQRFYPGLNLALYNNKDADRLIETIRESAHPESLGDEFAALEETIASDYPAVFLYSPHYLYAVRKNLRGVESGFVMEPRQRFRNVAEWYLKTKRVLK